MSRCQGRSEMSGGRLLSIVLQHQYQLVLTSPAVLEIDHGLDIF